MFFKVKKKASTKDLRLHKQTKQEFDRAYKKRHLRVQKDDQSESKSKYEQLKQGQTAAFQKNPDTLKTKFARLDRRATKLSNKLLDMMENSGLVDTGHKANDFEGLQMDFKKFEYLGSEEVASEKLRQRLIRIEQTKSLEGRAAQAIASTAHNSINVQVAGYRAWMETSQSLGETKYSAHQEIGKAFEGLQEKLVKLHNQYEQKFITKVDERPMINQILYGDMSAVQALTSIGPEAIQGFYTSLKHAADGTKQGVIRTAITESVVPLISMQFSKYVAMPLLKKHLTGKLVDLYIATEGGEKSYLSLAIDKVKSLMESKKMGTVAKSRVGSAFLDKMKEAKENLTKKTSSFGRADEKTPYTLETRTSIVEVIPGYLRKILSSISNGVEVTHDFTTGEWMTKSDATLANKRKLDDPMKDVVTYSKIKKYVKGNSDRRQKYFEAIENGTADEHIFHDMDLSKKSMKRLRKIIKQDQHRYEGRKFFQEDQEAVFQEKLAKDNEVTPLTWQTIFTDIKRREEDKSDVWNQIEEDFSGIRTSTSRVIKELTAWYRGATSATEEPALGSSVAASDPKLIAHIKDKVADIKSIGIPVPKSDLTAAVSGSSAKAISKLNDMVMSSVERVDGVLDTAEERLRSVGAKIEGFAGSMADDLNRTDEGRKMDRKSPSKSFTTLVTDFFEQTSSGTGVGVMDAFKGLMQNKNVWKGILGATLGMSLIGKIRKETAKHPEGGIMALIKGLLSGVKGVANTALKLVVTPFMGLADLLGNTIGRLFGGGKKAKAAAKKSEPTESKRDPKRGLNLRKNENSDTEASRLESLKEKNQSKATPKPSAPTKVTPRPQADSVEPKPTSTVVGAPGVKETTSTTPQASPTNQPLEEKKPSTSETPEVTNSASPVLQPLNQPAPQPLIGFSEKRKLTIYKPVVDPMSLYQTMTMVNAHMMSGLQESEIYEQYKNKPQTTLQKMVALNPLTSVHQMDKQGLNPDNPSTYVVGQIQAMFREWSEKVKQAALNRGRAGGRSRGSKSAGSRWVAGEAFKGNVPVIADVVGNPSAAEFINSIAPHAMDMWVIYGVLPSVCVAQACLETGYGEAAPGHNYFGIKGSGDAGSQNLATLEDAGGGSLYGINDDFGAYSGMRASVEAYGKLIGTVERYAAAVGEKDYRKAITAIWEGGYATDSTYVEKIVKIIELWGLDALDKAAIEFTEKENKGDSTRTNNTGSSNSSSSSNDNQPRAPSGSSGGISLGRRSSVDKADIAANKITEAISKVTKDDDGKMSSSEMEENMKKALEWGRSQMGKVTYSMNYRNGPESYDCSSFIYYCLKNGGFKVPESPWTTVTMCADAEGPREYLEVVPGWEKFDTSNPPPEGCIIMYISKYDDWDGGHTGFSNGSGGVLHCTSNGGGDPGGVRENASGWNTILNVVLVVKPVGFKGSGRGSGGGGDYGEGGDFDWIDWKEKRPKYLVAWDDQIADKIKKRVTAKYKALEEYYKTGKMPGLEEDLGGYASHITSDYFKLDNTADQATSSATGSTSSPSVIDVLNTDSNGKPIITNDKDPALEKTIINAIYNHFHNTKTRPTPSSSQYSSILRHESGIGLFLHKSNVDVLDQILGKVDLLDAHTRSILVKLLALLEEFKKQYGHQAETTAKSKHFLELLKKIKALIVNINTNNLAHSGILVSPEGYAITTPGAGRGVAQESDLDFYLDNDMLATILAGG